MKFNTFIFWLKTARNISVIIAAVLMYNIYTETISDLWFIAVLVFGVFGLAFRKNLGNGSGYI